MKNRSNVPEMRESRLVRHESVRNELDLKWDANRKSGGNNMKETGTKLKSANNLPGIVLWPLHHSQYKALQKLNSM